MSDYETEVPNNLTMIATIWTPANAVVCMLGQESKLCGITPEFSESPWANYVFPDLSEVPVIIEDGKCDINEMVEIDPCVTFAEGSQQTDIEDIRNADLRAMDIGFDNFDSMRASIAIVADAIGGGADEVADKWNALFDKNVALVQERVASIPEESRSRVMHVVSEDGQLKASGNVGMVSDWIKAAGGVNAVASSEQTVDITPALLAEANPQLVIVGGENAKDVAAQILEDPEWANVPAVSGLSVLPNPVGLSAWDGPTPEAALQVLWVAEQLYPDTIDHLETIDATRDFYEEFYKFRISKCDAVAIMECGDPSMYPDCDDDPEKAAERVSDDEETDNE